MTQSRSIQIVVIGLAIFGAAFVGSLMFLAWYGRQAMRRTIKPIPGDAVELKKRSDGWIDVQLSETGETIALPALPTHMIMKVNRYDSPHLSRWFSYSFASEDVFPTNCGILVEPAISRQ